MLEEHKRYCGACQTMLENATPFNRKLSVCFAGPWEMKYFFKVRKSPGSHFP